MTKKVIVSSTDGKTFDVGMQCDIIELPAVLAELKKFLQPWEETHTVPVKISNPDKVKKPVEKKGYRKRSANLSCDNCGKTFKSEKWLENHARKCESAPSVLTRKKVITFPGSAPVLGTVNGRPVTGGPAE